MRALDDLVNQVRDPASRPHLAEAITAYNAGAYRAAIVSTWVAVALDITSKIRELADQGDAAAAVWAGDLDKAIAAGEPRPLGQIEADLLDVARDTFQFVDARQHRELSRLREDRHICAHPAFVSPEQVFTPAAELTRLHLTVAVDAVLSLPPVPGKKALERFITDTKSQTWPRGHRDLKAYLRTNFLDRGTASLKEGLAKVILHGVMVPPDDDQTLSRRLADAAHALADAAPDLFVLGLDAKVTRKLQGGSTIESDALLRLVGGLGDLSQTWDAFPGPTRAGILGAISSSTVRGLNEYGLFHRKLADPEAAVIIDQHVAGLDRSAGGEEDLVAVLVDLPDASTARHLWPHAVRMFAEAGSWRGAEKAMGGLIVPFASHLTAEDVDAIAHASIANGQIMYASGMPALMLYLFERAPRSPAHLMAWNRFLEKAHEATEEDDPGGRYSYPELREAVTKATP